MQICYLAMHLNMKKINRIHLGALVFYLLLAVISIFIIIKIDSFLLEHAFRNQLDYRGYLPISLRGIDPLAVNKTNYSRYVAEGSFIDDVLIEHRHHDRGLVDDHLVHGDGKTVIWVFGDSWVDGIKYNQKNLNTTKYHLSSNAFSKIRYISMGSWSPIIENLAFRNRLKETKEIPDIVVIATDQNDIGDSYCKYRPFVIRNEQHHLIGVLNNPYAQEGGAISIAIYKNLAGITSGIKYTIIASLNRFVRQEMFVSGVNDCSFDDLLLYQLGLAKTSYGATSGDVSEYYRKTTRDFIDEIMNVNRKTKIILASHDWAQHNLQKNNKDYMPNNISEQNILIAQQYKNVETLHLTFDKFYPNKSIDDVYLYPKDAHSHLKDYTVYANVISQKIDLILRK